MLILVLFTACTTAKSKNLDRSACVSKKGVFENLLKFTGKHLCQSIFFNKDAGLRPATLLKKRLCDRCSAVNFMKYLRTSVLQNTFGDCF